MKRKLFDDLKEGIQNSGQRIRVISARDMHKKERMIYEQAT